MEQSRQEDVCAFCLDNFDDDFDGDSPGERSWTELVCGHRYHDDCMDEYLHHRITANSFVELTCPMCRDVYAVSLPSRTLQTELQVVHQSTDCVVLIMLVKAAMALAMVGFVAIVIGFLLAVHELFLCALSAWMAAIVILTCIACVRVTEMHHTLIPNAGNVRASTEVLVVTSTN
jgi:hypothetical protein